MDLQKKINFFIGAGASTAFELPSMKELTTDFKKMIRSTRIDLEPLLENIYIRLEKIYGEDQVDIEALMSVIVSLQKRDMMKEALDDYTRFVLTLTDSNYNEPLKQFNDKNKVKEIESEYKKFIRAKFDLRSNNYNLILKIYGNLFYNINKLINPNTIDESDFGPFLDNHEIYYKNDTMRNILNGCLPQFTIFTTNYDTALESFCHFIQFPGLTTGARQNWLKTFKQIDINDFLNLYLNRSNNNYLRLIKLHGSINWIKNNEGNIIEGSYADTYEKIIESSPENFVREEVMIYPLSQKELYKSPYVQFFGILDTELRESKIWIVIGYSFRDVVIRSMFEDASDSIEKLILVHPHSDSIRELFSKKFQEKIIEIKEYFGGDGFKKVNQMVTSTLEDLTRNK